MDVEAYVSVHQPQWDRLAHLTRRQRRLTGAEADELVLLYQRVGTHLAALRAGGADPVAIGRLSGLIADARGAVTGAQAPVWRDISRYFLVSFPAALYMSRRWWLTIGLLFYLVAGWVAWRIIAHPEVLDSVATPTQIQQLVDEDFANYYTENPAQDFALRVWVNNATISAAVLAIGVLLVPVVFVLWSNAVNLGLMAGVMIGHDKGDVFFGLITPHGLLELTAVFVASAAGLRLGWAWIAPGPRTRMQALAQTGRATVGMAIGLAAILLVTGLIEAFVTPSPFPTAVRVGIGVIAEVAFFVYVWTLGRRAAQAGEYGDVEAIDREATAPVSA
ncbi:putative membrane protein SpoIIM required for sporulation [Kribbella sp. VKM Ac-2527]|uniref:Putative membrane protein SpoIIM required for sporulation n=1 Tax=Kribbella caucasensis TaxID=2512215 RepID=A0A4R6KJ67_9ACTN|nr:stage II sporulation protein M [Kribbella sp. VKM Ac-2527]TDO51344.1 putative membrane protein SpoIIM required for sporulation [Kribbella sp. VKM Ac-2527]